MTHQDMEYRLSIIRYLVRDLMHDLRTEQLTPVVDAAHLVALDELRTALHALDTISECVNEILTEV